MVADLFDKSPLVRMKGIVLGNVSEKHGAPHGAVLTPSLSAVYVLGSALTLGHGTSDGTFLRDEL